MMKFTEYIKLSEHAALQMVVHVLTSHSEKEKAVWFTQNHLQEILTLLNEVFDEVKATAEQEAVKRKKRRYRRVPFESEENPHVAPPARVKVDNRLQRLTGSLVRFAYKFAPRFSPQSCLPLHQQDKGGADNYSLDILNRKLVVYAYHRNAELPPTQISRENSLSRDICPYFKKKFHPPSDKDEQMKDSLKNLRKDASHATKNLPHEISFQLKSPVVIMEKSAISKKEMEEKVEKLDEASTSSSFAMNSSNFVMNLPLRDRLSRKDRLKLRKRQLEDLLTTSDDEGESEMEKSSKRSPVLQHRKSIVIDWVNQSSESQGAEAPVIGESEVVISDDDVGITSVCCYQEMPVAKLPLYKIQDIITSNRSYLKDIFSGKVFSQRHEDYKKGGTSRANLHWLIPLMLFTDKQHDCIANALLDVFCKNHDRYKSYVMCVLLPEMLIKIFMDMHTVSHPEAEEALMNQPQESSSLIE